MKGGKFIAALVLAIPVVLFPIALVWYINSGKPYHIHSSATNRNPLEVNKRELIYGC